MSDLRRDRPLVHMIYQVWRGPNIIYSVFCQPGIHPHHAIEDMRYRGAQRLHGIEDVHATLGDIITIRIEAQQHVVSPPEHSFVVKEHLFRRNCLVFAHSLPIHINILYNVEVTLIINGNVYWKISFGLADSMVREKTVHAKQRKRTIWPFGFFPPKATTDRKIGSDDAKDSGKGSSLLKDSNAYGQSQDRSRRTESSGRRRVVTVKGSLPGDNSDIDSAIDDDPKVSGGADSQVEQVVPQQKQKSRKNRIRKWLNQTNNGTDQKQGAHAEEEAQKQAWAKWKKAGTEAMDEISLSGDEATIADDQYEIRHRADRVLVGDLRLDSDSAKIFLEILRTIDIQITELDLSNSRLQGRDSSRLQIIEVVRSSKVTSLIMRNCGLTAEVVASLRRELQDAQLNNLDLSYNPLMGTDGILEVGELVQSTGVTRLFLRKCALHGAHLLAVRKTLDNHKLIELDVSDNPAIGLGDGMAALGYLAREVKLDSLVLQECLLTPDDMLQLRSSLGQSKLMKLDISKSKPIASVADDVDSGSSLATESTVFSKPASIKSVEETPLAKILGAQLEDMARDLKRNLELTTVHYMLPQNIILPILPSVTKQFIMRHWGISDEGKKAIAKELTERGLVLEVIFGPKSARNGTEEVIRAKPRRAETGEKILPRKELPKKKNEKRVHFTDNEATNKQPSNAKQHEQTEENQDRRSDSQEDHQYPQNRLTSANEVGDTSSPASEQPGEAATEAKVIKPQSVDAHEGGLEGELDNLAKTRYPNEAEDCATKADRMSEQKGEESTAKLEVTEVESLEAYEGGLTGALDILTKTRAPNEADILNVIRICRKHNVTLAHVRGMAEEYSDNLDHFRASVLYRCALEMSRHGDAPYSTSKVISAAGGIISLLDCKVSFPEGAVSNLIEVKVALNMEGFEAEGLIPVSPVIELTPCMALSKEVTIKLATWCRTPAGGKLHLYYKKHEQSRWEYEQSLTIEKSENVGVEFEVDKFCKYCMFVTTEQLGDSVMEVQSKLYRHIEGNMSNHVFVNCETQKQLIKDHMEGMGYVAMCTKILNFDVKADDKIQMTLYSDDGDHKFESKCVINELFLKRITGEESFAMPKYFSGMVDFFHNVAIFRGGVNIVEKYYNHKDRATFHQPELPGKKASGESINAGNVVVNANIAAVGGSKITTESPGSYFATVQPVPDQPSLDMRKKITQTEKEKQDSLPVLRDERHQITTRQVPAVQNVDAATTTSASRPAFERTDTTPSPSQAGELGEDAPSLRGQRRRSH